MEAHQAKLAFFKADVCRVLLERLVGHYMLLSEEVLCILSGHMRSCDTTIATPTSYLRSFSFGRTIRKNSVSAFSLPHRDVLFDVWLPW